MRISRLSFSVLLILVAGAVRPMLAAELTPASVWMTDFAKAEAEAKRLHRPLVVHFHTHYCPPCRKMEKDVLNTPQVLRQLDAGFVAVKVNLSVRTNAAVQAKYRVEAMPTDLVLNPEGKVLVRSEGYDDRTTADRQKYLNSIARIDAQFAKEGKRLARTDAAAGTKAPVETAARAREAAPAPQAVPAVATATPMVNKLVPEPSEPKPIDDPAAPIAKEQPAREAATVFVALDGYCPVTLRTTRTWKAGSKQYSLEHDGQTYLFLAAKNRDEFKSNPARYAPRLMGCDPVVLADSDLAVRGSTKFGAYYEGDLFLFESADTRARFRKDPARYTRIKHVLKPEDIQNGPKVASATTK
jgi:YHS domain-containing protein/thiol-disulfide isomerase/thioredoxin